MRPTAIAFAGAALLAGSSFALAQGMSGQAPGQTMQQQGSVPGSPGASGFAPGQQMQQKGSVPGSPGASGFAPGQQTTTGVRVESDTKAGVKAKTKTGGQTGIRARSKSKAGTTGASSETDIKAGTGGVKTDADVKVKTR